MSEAYRSTSNHPGLKLSWRECRELLGSGRFSTTRTISRHLGTARNVFSRRFRSQSLSLPCSTSKSYHQDISREICIPGTDSRSSAASFSWAVGINITSSILLETPTAAGGYGFGPKSIGYLYFTPLVAVALGEAFGHWFNDWNARRYVSKHDGIFKPETRLVTTYIAAGLMIPGLIICGQTLQKHLHYAGIIIGWGMYVTGVMLASVSITAYALDSYGTASSEVSGLLNFARGMLLRL